MKSLMKIFVCFLIISQIIDKIAFIENNIILDISCDYSMISMQLMISASALAEIHENFDRILSFSFQFDK
jgi:hypothetical protein